MKYLLTSVCLTIAVFILWALPWSNYAWIVDSQTWLFEGGQYRVVGYYNGSWKGEHYQIGAVLEREGFWEKYNRNPVLSVADGEGWDSRHVKDPYSVKIRGIYYLYYAGTDGKGEGYSIGLANSTDGVRYTKMGVVVDRGTFPIVWIGESRSPSRWKMLFGRDCALHYAYSDDGSYWTQYSENPVFTLPGVCIIPGNVVVAEGELRFYFGARRDSIDHAELALASSAEGPYTVHSTLFNLIPYSVTPREVIRDDDVWKMFYTRFGGAEGIRESTHLALSSDGLKWLLDDRALLEAPDPGADRWDAVSAENLVLVKEFTVE